MQLTRRRLLRTASGLAAITTTGLLAACQSATAPSAPSAATTSAAGAASASASATAAPATAAPRAPATSAAPATPAPLATPATPALSSDGSTVYLGFAAGGFNGPSKATFYALKAPASGTEPQVSWTVDLGAVRVMASPTVGPDGTIYVGNSAGQLFAIAPNGSVRWTAQTGPAIKSAPALALDGTVYHASSDGKLYA